MNTCRLPVKPRSRSRWRGCLGTIGLVAASVWAATAMALSPAAETTADGGASPAAPIAGADDRPGKTNPINNPKYLTLFPVDSIGVMVARAAATSTDVLDLAAETAALDRWTQYAEHLRSDDVCTTTPRRRMRFGRVISPDFDQPICLTEIGLSLYTGKPVVGDGSFLAYPFKDPGLAGTGRGFDAAAGQLDSAVASDGFAHMDIVTARRNLDQRLAVEIVRWMPGSGDDPAGRARLVSLTSYVGPKQDRVTGDTAIALGDFDRDGRLDIVTAADITTGATGPGTILLNSFTYDPKARALVLKSRRTEQTTATPRSIVLAAADYAGLGFEQLLLGHYPHATTGTPGAIEMSWYTLGKDLDIAPPRLTERFGTPAAGSYFAIAPGLFTLTPSGADQPGFHRRQLALAYTGADARVMGQVAAIMDGGHFRKGPELVLSAANRPAHTAGLGPALAVGNFIGLKQDNVDPRDQFAVSLPIAHETQVGAVYPELLVATVAPDSLALTPVWREPLAFYTQNGAELAIPLVAFDRRGDSFYLGTPVHIQIPLLIDPQYVIEMPPRHVDCLPDPAAAAGAPAPCGIVNVSGDSSFNVRLVDRHEETLQQTTTNAMSAQFGASLSQTVGGSVGGGFMEIAEAEVSTQVQHATSYEQEAIERNVNSNYRSIVTERSAATTTDDHLIWNSRMLDIWRYPVYGLDLKRDKHFPFYDLLIPGPLTRFSGGGLSTDWYNPRHANNNALSYPAVADPDFPSDLGEFSFTTEGKPKTVKQPLNERMLRIFDGNEQAFDLAWSDESGGTSEKSFNYSLSNSTDITLGFTASATLEVVNFSTFYEGTVSLNERSSWESSVLAERHVRNSGGVTLFQPENSGITPFAYGYLTLVYITGNGGLKVAHATDPLAAASGRAWWRKYYGHKPDPAVTLPQRLELAGGIGGDWQLTPGERYFWMRGLALTSAEPDPETGTFPYLSGGVKAGERVRLLAAISNYSIDTPASGVVVAFYYQRLDPGNYEPTGKPVEIGRSQPIDIAPRGRVQVPLVWDTTGREGQGAGTPYRFIIKVDPNDQIEELHETAQGDGGNNRGIWPWAGSAFWVLNQAAGPQGAATGAGSEPEVAVAVVPADDPESNVGARFGRLAEVSIKSQGSDPRMRQLIVTAEDEAAGPKTVLAARTLWGLGEGEQQIRIPLLMEDGQTPRAIGVWLSPGKAGLTTGFGLSATAPWR